MKTINSFIFILAIISLSSCSSASMTGTVVDAETGKPIEGAVIHAHWSITKGIGLSYGEDYKTSEALSDQNGRFKIEGVLNPFVNPPIIVIYKEGYVAWRNDFVFQGYLRGQRRVGFKWQDGNVYKLDQFKHYSHSLHIRFITFGLTINSKLKLRQAYSHEDFLASKEEELFRRKFKERRPGESQDAIWQEIINELYSLKGGNIQE